MVPPAPDDQGGSGELPAELLDIADTATRALTVDPGLGSVSRLLSLADTLKHLHTRDVTFVTMPTIEDPANPNRLLPQQPEDDVLGTGPPRQAGRPSCGELRIREQPAGQHRQLPVSCPDAQCGGQHLLQHARGQPGPGHPAVTS